jgi:hypothetical protein
MTAMVRTAPLLRKAPLARDKCRLKRSRLRPISVKRAKRYAAARRVNAALKRRSGGRCELAISPDCTGRGTHPHHVTHGGGDTLENCLWACKFCNGFCEDHPAEAVRAGMRKFRAKELPESTAQADPEMETRS